jgi:hypothetical protein
MPPISPPQGEKDCFTGREKAEVALARVRLRPVSAFRLRPKADMS